MLYSVAFNTLLYLFFFFFLNDPAPTEIYSLPLHDALPIPAGRNEKRRGERTQTPPRLGPPADRHGLAAPDGMRSAMLNAAGAHLVSGHPPIAPGSRPRME